MVRVPVYLPKALHKALVRRASVEERSASRVMLELVQEYLGKPAKKGGR